MECMLNLKVTQIVDRLLPLHGRESEGGSRQICDGQDDRSTPDMIDFHILVDPMHAAKDRFGIGSALASAKRAGIRHAGLIVACEGLDFRFMPGFSHAVRTMSLHLGITAWPGVELVHIPQPLLEEAVLRSREHGAQLVLARGECLYDNAERGLNLAAISAGIDILTCPGILDEEAAGLAAERDISVEFSSSPRCGIAAAQTVMNCLRAGCSMVCGSAATCADELPTEHLWEHLIRGSCSERHVADRFRAHLSQSGMRLAQRMMQSELKIKKSINNA